MDWNQVKFCQPINGCGLTRENLANDICANLFHANSGFAQILLDRYRLMDVNKNTPISNETIAQWNQNGLSCVFESDRPDAYLPVPSNRVGTTDAGVTSLMQIGKFGFDLPVWVTNPGECTKRVLLLTQDPKRVNDEIGKSSLSSPFGLHSQNCRRPDNMVGGTMAQIVGMLCDEGAAVYLTDINKFFAGSGSRRIITSKKRAFRQFFDVEVANFNPTHIVVFGRIAHAEIAGEPCDGFAAAVANRGISGEYQSIKTLSLMHISKNNQWRIQRAGWEFSDYFISNIRNFVNGGAHA